MRRMRRICVVQCGSKLMVQGSVRIHEQEASGRPGDKIILGNQYLGMGSRVEER